MWNLQIWPCQHVYNASTKLSAKNWPSDILFVGNINKYVIIMHLICINHIRQKKVVAILFTCVLTSMQNFAVIGPFGAEIWRGGQIEPPPPPQ